MDDSFLLQALVSQVPLLAVYLLGMILAVVFWTRCAGAAVMTLIGCAVLIITTVVMAFVQASLFERFRAGGMTPEQYAQTMRAIALVGSGTRAVGLMVVIVAVFMGRARPQSVGATEQATW